MKKIMLINLPKRIYNQSVGFSIYLPLGLLSIAAVIKNKCELKILDCLVEKFEINRTEHYTYYGTSSENIRQAIIEFNPEVVGISIPFTSQAENALEIAKICKEINSKIIVILGGPDASIRYEWLLKNTVADFCVVGEGEKTFLEFVEKLNTEQPLTEIKGLACREDSKKYQPRPFLENLDELPFPAYEYINMGTYQNNKYLYCNRSEMRRSLTVITSRGCPFGCVFCAIRLHMGRKFRTNSPEYVLKHLKFIINTYNITNFHFEDDNISVNKERFEKILDLIIENNLNIKLDTPNGIRADTLNYELLKKIKKSGCLKLKIAVESGNQDVLNRIIKKNTSLDYLIKIADYCKKLKIKTAAFYIIGFPGETLKNMQETIDFAMMMLRKYDTVPSLHLATPLYGTDLYKLCLEKGYIKENLTSEELDTASHTYGNPPISTENFSKEDLKNLVKEYERKLKKELLFFALRHPLYTLERIKNKPLLIKKHLLQKKAPVSS